MAASPKPKAAPPAKVAAKPATRRAAPAKPFLRFFHSAELRKKTLSVLALIENAPDGEATQRTFDGAVVELEGAIVEDSHQLLDAFGEVPEGLAQMRLRGLTF